MCSTVSLRKATESSLRIMASKKRSVNVGKVKGETPRKIFYFRKEEAPNEVESATPERAFFAEEPLKGVLKTSIVPSASPSKEVDSYSSPQSSSERPSTSRGKQKPTPDEFADYVVPSPERVKPNESPVLQGKILVFEEKGSEEAKGSNTAEGGREEGFNKKEEIVAIGCWLFGSALAV